MNRIQRENDQKYKQQNNRPPQKKLHCTLPPPSKMKLLKLKKF